MKIVLIGCNREWLQKISVSLAGKLPVKSLECLNIIQTVCEYETLLMQQNFKPTVVFVDQCIIDSKGDQIPTDDTIRNLKEYLGYKGPIIACAWGQCNNNCLIQAGATHRVDQGRDATPTSIADKTIDIMKANGLIPQD